MLYGNTLGSTGLVLPDREQVSRLGSRWSLSLQTPAVRAKPGVLEIAAEPRHLHSPLSALPEVAPSPERQCVARETTCSPCFFHY